jgi:hypothetical protein
MCIEDDIKYFFSSLQYYVSVSRKAREVYSPTVAPLFSVFDYINVNEILLSRIISDLLNPKGSHGQGSVFLIIFLERLIDLNCILPLDWYSQVEKVTVINEAYTTFLPNSARRIDIRIEMPSCFGIGIENKPWTVEQPEQLSDYCAELACRYKSQFVLVFLSQKGRSPQSIPPEEWQVLKDSGKCATIFYSDNFLDWLLECQKMCQSEKIRYFIKDFMKYIQDNFCY